MLDRTLVFMFVMLILGIESWLESLWSKSTSHNFDESWWSILLFLILAVIGLKSNLFWLILFFEARTANCFKFLGFLRFWSAPSENKRLLSDFGLLFLVGILGSLHFSPVIFNIGFSNSILLAIGDITLLELLIFEGLRHLFFLDNDRKPCYWLRYTKLTFSDKFLIFRILEIDLTPMIRIIRILLDNLEIHYIVWI